jgi:capsular exopolysaccharide synthesis family protein
MSWYYEALQRAERKGSQPRAEGEEEDFAGPDGDSFLAEMESISSLSCKIPAENVHAQTPRQSVVVAVATEEAPIVRSEPRSAQAAVEMEEIPAGVPLEIQAGVEASRNGYRHHTLPMTKSSRLIFRTDMHGLAAEQFRMLRRKLTQDFPNGAVLMVTSPSMGDGKTLTSINLCSCLAELGEPTLLVEADVRRPTVGKVLSCPQEAPGMEDVLTGKAQPNEAIHEFDDLHFHAAMVANVPRDPSKLINAVGFGYFLNWARERFRWIVLDASPVLPAADVADLLPLADGVLVVVRAESTPKEMSKRTFEILGKHVCGVIFNNATVSSNPHYRYLSGYYAGSPEARKK